MYENITDTALFASVRAPTAINEFRAVLSSLKKGTAISKKGFNCENVRARLVVFTFELALGLLPKEDAFIVLLVILDISISATLSDSVTNNGEFHEIIHGYVDSNLA